MLHPEASRAVAVGQVGERAWDADGRDLELAVQGPGGFEGLDVLELVDELEVAVCRALSWVRA